MCRSILPFKVHVKVVDVAQRINHCTRSAGREAKKAGDKVPHSANTAVHHFNGEGEEVERPGDSTLWSPPDGIAVDMAWRLSLKGWWV